MNGFVSNIAAKIAAWKEKYGIWILGFLVNDLMERLINWVAYSLIIKYMGFWLGMTVLIPIGFITCYGTMVFYDWSKTDWIAIEKVKSMKEYDGKWMFAKIFWKLVKKSDWLAFILLSVLKDSFITTAYLRKGSYQFNGMNKRDWKIFLASLVIGCFAWGFFIKTGLSVFEYAWDIAPKLF
jgi:hypothetical protein